jgi:hypothetical protein
MQHPDDILANICMKHLKILETYACNIHMYMQHPDLLLQHPDKTFTIFV